MSGTAFIPQGNGVAIATSTTSSRIAMPNPGATTLCVTNRSTANAWVSWGDVTTVAAFPAPGVTAGVQGMEVSPGAQVTIGTQGTAAYVAAILDGGTGALSAVPGDGL